MSKIQEAIRRLQNSAPQAVNKSAGKTNGEPQAPRTVVPIAKKKSVEFDGEKHHIDEETLIHGGLLAPLDQAIPVADEFRRIKRPLIENVAIQPVGFGDHMNLIMVASPYPGAGKTFCSVNLAASISLERELNVLLVDADVAKPHISREFGLEGRPGLIDVLESDHKSVESVLVRTDINNIQVLPAGSKHSQSTELLASERMAEVAKELATRYADRIIILDSPPLLITSEAQALAKQVGQIALVVECGETTRKDLQDTLDLLNPDKAINLILNKAMYKQGGGYYGGSYGFDGFNDN